MIVKRKKIMSISLFFLLPSIAYASAFYCNNKIISVGDSKYEVLSKCPSPEYVERSEREVIKRVSSTEIRKEIIQRETLIYDLGPDTILRAVVIENDRVVEINTLGKSLKSR